MTTTMEKLERLACQQEKWRSISPADKLAILQEMRFRVRHYKGYEKACERGVTETIGLPLHTPDGAFEKGVEHSMMVTFFTGILDYLIVAYKVFSGKEAPPKLPVRQLDGGQVVVQVFPFMPDEKAGPLNQATGEVFLDPTMVTSPEDVKLFDYDMVVQNGQGPGAAIVLGAGNFAMLTTGDVFSVLFRDNRCCLVKHHPMREYLDDVLRFIMAPMVEAGFLDFESNADFDRQALYAPNVAAVHMTGGKDTHDKIVWGSSDPKKRRDKPMLKARMTAELGCVTPWIIPECTMTPSELKGQAMGLAKAVYQNCSFMCNSPKVLIVSHAWKQRDEFVDVVVKYFRQHRNPVAYYPGVKERWQAFKDHASPQCMEIECDMDVEKRELLKPLMLDEPLLLPWLINPIQVDFSTPQGKQASASQYAFRNEPFAPVLTVCSIESTSNPEEYLETAVKLCNECIFGSLTATLTVPASVQGDASIEKALHNLKYGAVTTNAWSGLPYIMKGTHWGAHPGERLDAVESGIGSIQGYCFIPHVVKSVVRLPPSGPPSILFLEPTRDNAAILHAIANVAKNPGLWTVLKLLWYLLLAQIKSFITSLKFM